MRFSNHPKPLGGMILALSVLLSGFAAFAQSGLTTIQDTLFKADGTRFSGTLSIQWSTFDANNIGTIVQQSKSVTVVNGNLLVQLAPNAAAQAPANVYTVRYQSDGNQQFTETWTVPSATQAMTVAQVRTGMLTSSSGGVAGNQTPIVESSVVGLVADLAQRPIKGPGFGTGSVAVINQDGQIETAIGNVGDCVYVDGTAGPCGSQQTQFFDAETPGGLVDGTNTTFTLANPPSGSSLMLFRNGLYMKAGFDYTLSGATIQFVQGAVPQPLDTLVASYRIDPAAGNLGELQSGALHASAQAQVLCSANGSATTDESWTDLGGCDVPADALRPGDRIEARFDLSHMGGSSGFDFQVTWGATVVLSRHGSQQDSAIAGRVESAISDAGAQITTESWGTVLSFLPGIASSPALPGLRVDISGRLSTAGDDVLKLISYTILRYPGN